MNLKIVHLSIDHILHKINYTLKDSKFLLIINPPPLPACYYSNTMLSTYQNDG